MVIGSTQELQRRLPPNFPSLRDFMERPRDRWQRRHLEPVHHIPLATPRSAVFRDPYVSVEIQWWLGLPVSGTDEHQQKEEYAAGRNM